MTVRRCVLTAGHDGGHMFALDDRPKLRGDGEPRCAAYDPPPTDGMPAAPEAFTLSAPTPLDVEADRERREAESSEQPVCPHCGFAPVSHEEWERTVLEHFGENAGAVLVEITQRAFNLGIAAGKLDRSTRQAERRKIAERLRTLHAARVRSATPHLLHVDLDVLADDVENDRPLAFVE